MYMTQPSLLTQEEAQKLTHLVQGIQDPQQMVKLAEAIFELAVLRGASDVHLEPFENEAQVRFRIDGTLQDVLVLSNDIYEKLLARIKVLANLKLDEHRQPQDGRFKGKFGEQVVDFRVAVMPLLFGEKLAIRVLPQQTKALSLVELGMDERGAGETIAQVRKPYGMILVCGPTGVGKSTTLYALLQAVIAERGLGVNINTVEDPVEYAIPRVSQAQVSGQGLTFATALRGLLRQDADVVMVGEIRDAATAHAAVEASLTGRLLLSSLHTRDAVGAIIRLLDIGIEPYLVSSVLSLVIAQRLVRTICTSCVETYELDPKAYEELEKGYGLTTVLANIEKRLPHLAPVARPPMLYRGVGCDACMHSGYRGRTAVFEVLAISDAMHMLILQRATAHKLREQAVQDGMVTMFQDGFAKALSGRTTLEEVLKVTLE